MKKYLAIIFISIIFTGCSDNKSKSPEVNNPTIDYKYDYTRGG